MSSGGAGDLFHDLDAGEARHAQVAVPVPAGGPYTYSIPEPLRRLALPGMRVRVPFAGRKLVGAIVATSGPAPADLEASRIRDLLDCLDPLPLLPPVLLALTRKVADQTLSTWGEAIRSALPAQLRGAGRRRATPTAAGIEAAASGVAAGARARLLRALGKSGGRGLQLATLARRAGVEAICAHCYGLGHEGLLRVEDEWAEGVGGRWERLLRPAPHIDEAAAREATRRAPAQRRALETLWRSGADMGASELAEAAACSPATLRSLLDRGLIEAYRAPAGVAGSAPFADLDEGAGRFRLNEAQRLALARIEAALDGAEQRALYLHGVTGSGKTEVYLRAARRVVEGGRSAILLVPEIGLTPLLEHRARAVLGEAVAVLHSGMAAGQRLETWWQARRGRVRVVVGPRSAVFAPLADVGLIVVDEEQDAAYKQDERPRYHGREVALWRAELEGAVVVLGSATPAVESYHRAGRGDQELLALPYRVAGRPLPDVRMVDMRETYRQTGRTLLSEELEQALDERLKAGEQALLLLNRRGFARALLCRVCGDRLTCPQCDVGLTLHRAEQALRCHYCDHHAAVPRRCPQCGAEALADIGHGTQRLQQALDQRFPAARIRRFDADETRRRGAHGRILSAFARGEIDVLVGTQMLAKGHDFPGVTLVGVVGADDSLGLPDFRAAETTFQLVTQMAGRAGRGAATGSVVVQAFRPDHYALQAAAAHDYESFYRQELVYRRRLGYPPFGALVACECRGKNLPVLKEEADRLAAALRARAARGLRVLGPASPPLARLRGLHRLQLLVRADDRDIARQVVLAALADCRRRRALPRDLRIDVDPVNLM